MKLNAPARLATSGLLALSVAAGISVSVTSPANAASSVGRSACTEPVGFATTVSTTVKLRTGPGTKYLAKGQLSKNTRVLWSCNRGSTGSGKSWGYVLVKTGANKGKWGWVYRIYINTPMQLD
ncbi:hypothetical protein ABZ896_42695 [Streptomyces sp. NPDC047072]|uniref:hypothetical protein n=1 Tax=Streptomyces sp. NPDC047072 TaxID=3154809 RepID=UPI0033F8A5C6